MNLLHIGNRYVNIAIATSIIDDGQVVTVIFVAAWPGDGGKAERSCEHFYNDEARQLRRWLERNSERIGHA